MSFSSKAKKCGHSSSVLVQKENRGREQWHRSSSWWGGSSDILSLLWFTSKRFLRGNHHDDGASIGGSFLSYSLFLSHLCSCPLFECLLHQNDTVLNQWFVLQHLSCFIIVVSSSSSSSSSSIYSLFKTTNSSFETLKGIFLRQKWWCVNPLSSCLFRHWIPFSTRGVSLEESVYMLPYTVFTQLNQEESGSLFFLEVFSRVFQDGHFVWF